MQININPQICYTIDQLKERFKGRRVYLFGAGVDGELFADINKGDFQIIAFVDNKRHGNTVRKIPIISFAELINERNNEIIIITSSGYAVSIAEQLEAAGYLQGEDFCLWDEQSLYYIDRNTNEIINFLKDNLCYNIESSDKKILIPYEAEHDASVIIYAYVSYYLSKKYDASIEAYLRYGMPESKISPSLRMVYEAFNTKRFVEQKLSPAQEIEAKRLFDDIWRNIADFDSWKDITIYEIPFGGVLMESYQRFEIPSFVEKNKGWEQFLLKEMRTIVFWYYHFKENNYSVVVMTDGIASEGYIRNIAVSMDIPTYAIYYTEAERLFMDFHFGNDFKHYKRFWNELSKEDQKKGIAEAKERLIGQLSGKEGDIIYRDNTSPYQCEGREPVLQKSEKLKVLICPHIFEENPKMFGYQIFDSYISWLQHLGELSENTDYDWYIKPHPWASFRDEIIIESFVKRYTKIHLLPAMTSPKQLKKEGIRYALTVFGSIGREYPLLGIDVINAGNNPHIAFDFDYNPKTKEEYDDLIYHLEDLSKSINEEEIYQFYAIYYIYLWKMKYHAWEYFFVNKELSEVREKMGTWKYTQFLKEWSLERHEEILENVDKLFHDMDCWRSDVFYREGIRKP